MTRVLVAIGLLLLFPGPLWAATPGWITATNTDCRIWNPGVPPGWTVTWSGPCQDGVAQGQGVLQWRDAGRPTVRYEGGFRAGKLSGHGVMTFASGERRESEWRDNNRNGPGVTVYADGNRYVGAYRDDQMSGQGVFAFASGNRYEGAFFDGAFEGHGVKTWPNGDRYEGAWHAGKANGQGHLLSRGATFDGVWHDGCFRIAKGWVAIDVDVGSCR
jgi:hypothetical protein